MAAPSECLQGAGTLTKDVCRPEIPKSQLALGVAGTFLVLAATKRIHICWPHLASGSLKATDVPNAPIVTSVD